MTAMSPRHDQLRTALQRLSGHDTVPVTYTGPNHTHARNGGSVMTRPSTVRRYSPQTEAVIVKLARKRAARAARRRWLAGVVWHDVVAACISTVILVGVVAAVMYAVGHMAP